MSSYKRKVRPLLFSKDIEQLLYSLGDSYCQESTINVLEDCLVEFLADVSQKALMYAKSKNRNRIKIDDFPFSLRKDPFMLSRLEYIVNQSIRIENAKKMFDDDDKKYANLADSDEDSRKKKSKQHMNRL